MSVSGVDADDVGGTAAFGAVVGIGGQLDVDLVGFVDDVVVGNDVAAGVDNEAGAEGLALSANAAICAIISTLAATAEEAVEEVLHVALVAVVATVGVVRGQRKSFAAATAEVGRLLRQRYRVDVDHRWSRPV